MPDGIIAHRVELRPCTAADVPGFMEGLNDWRVAQRLPTVPFPYTENDARAFIASTAHATPRTRLLSCIGAKASSWDW